MGGRVGESADAAESALPRNLKRALANYCAARLDGVMFPIPVPMRAALDAAALAAAHGEVPVGAVVVRDGVIIATSANAPRALHAPTAHAEMLAMRAGAIAHARIARLYYGAADPKGGAGEHGPMLFGQPTIHHRPEIYPGIAEGESAALLRDFFATRR